jgi:hypothetical protein
MTPRQRRLTLVIGILAGVSIAGALALTAFRENVTFFFDPSQVAQGKVTDGEHFRLGGMVSKGSIQREPGSLEVRFVVTDFAHEVPVSYTGVLPDLFREGRSRVYALATPAAPGIPRPGETTRTPSSPCSCVTSMSRGDAIDVVARPSSRTPCTPLHRWRGARAAPSRSDR